MPNRLRIRGAAPALVLALALGCLTPAFADPASKPQAGGSTEPPAASTKTSHGSESAAGGAESTGPEPFVPSEKISADSAISFPVDI
jgi:hypothetical protein